MRCKKHDCGVVKGRCEFWTKKMAEIRELEELQQDIAIDKLEQEEYCQDQWE